MRDGRDRRSRPEIGTETVPVELVELTKVGPSGSPVGPRLVLIGAIVLGAMAVVILDGRPASRVASPSAAPVAFVSVSPTAVPTALSTPAATVFRPTAAPPTTPPTPAPPWQWTLRDFTLDPVPSVEGVWNLDGKLVSLLRSPELVNDQSVWSVATLDDANLWEPAPAPSAILELEAGTVVDGRLWFFAKVGGVTDAETTWRLISTDGATWASQGIAEGLPAFDGASNLARAGNTWVITTSRDEGIGIAHDAMSWSTDGRQWHAASVPSLRSNVQYHETESFGGALLTVGVDFDTLESQEPFILRSTDGQTWRRTTFELPTGAFTAGLVCGSTVCIAAYDDPVAAPSTTQELLESADGARWTRVAVDVPSATENIAIEAITPTPNGFIALMGSPERAVLSPDGVAWRAVDVLPPGSFDPISELAVGGDRIVAIVPWTSSDEPNRYWVGSLAAMGG